MLEKTETRTGISKQILTQHPRHAFTTGLLNNFITFSSMKSQTASLGHTDYV